MVLRQNLKLDEYNCHLIIYITGNEIIKRMAETQRSGFLYKECKRILFTEPTSGLPIVVSSDITYDQKLSEFTNNGPDQLYRIKLLNIKNLSYLRIINIDDWKIWEKENLELNLEALELYPGILISKGYWNVIYDTPGKDWSKLYISLLIQ